MTIERHTQTVGGAHTITRAAVIAQVEQRLSGQLSDAALAAWAFDRFYAAELGQEQYEAGAEAAIDDALDTLMFDDDPSFRLDEEELRNLIARLSSV
jgi:hypothetical protein